LLSPVRGVAASGAAREAIAIIVSRDLALRDLTPAELRRLFLGEVTERAGKRLVPFNYGTDNPLRQDFDLMALGMRGDEVGRYWVDRRMRGQGLPPRLVPNAIVARAVVARLAGAVAYVPASQLDASVVALRIGGRDHTDPAYPYWTLVR
jgi:hypothetical protein